MDVGMDLRIAGGSDSVVTTVVTLRAETLRGT